MSFRNFPMVPRVVYGRGSFNQLGDILALKRLGDKAPFIFLVDDVFKGKESLISRIPLQHNDKIIYTDSKTAISWVKKKTCNTKLEQNDKNK